MRPSKKLLIAIISIFLISSVPVSAHAESTTIQQNKDILSQIVVFQLEITIKMKLMLW